MNMRWLVPVLFFFPFVLAAQEKTESSIDQYLDDGGISTAKNFLKINLISVYQGDLGVSLERRLSKDFAIEVGAGVLLPYFNDYFIYPETNGSTFYKPNVGGSLLLEGRIVMDPLIFCVPLRVRFYPYQLRLFDVSANLAIPWVWNNGFLIDLSIGIGLQFQKSLNEKTYLFDANSLVNYDSAGIQSDNVYPEAARLIFPVSLKIGYRF
jgi:hypothetical protein